MRYAMPVALALFLLHTPAFAQGIPGHEQYRLVLSGIEAYGDGKYEEAVEALQKARTIFPDDPDIPFFTGLAYLQLGHPGKAIDEFRKTIEKSPAHIHARFHLGVTLIRQKLYADAIPHLEKVHATDPGRADLGFFLGKAYFHLWEYEKALSHLETGKTSDRDIRDLTLHYIGLCRHQMGRHDEAAIAFKTLSSDPTSHLAVPSKRLIEAMETDVRIEKPWSIDLTAKVQYDDNVVLVPTTTDVYFPDNQDRSSVLELIYIRGEYALVRRRTWDLSASYAIYQSITNSIREFDVQDHILTVDAIARNILRATPYQFQVSYAYDYLLQDYKYLLQRHAIRAALALHWTPRHMTAIQYAMTLKEFAQHPTILEDDRDASNHEAGVIHYLRYDEAKHYIKAGYVFDMDTAQGNNWDYLGHRFLVGFQYTLPMNIRANVDCERKATRYTNADSFYGENRRDTSKALTASLSKRLTPVWTASLEYSRHRNASNLAQFDYSKALYSLGVSGAW